MKTYTKEELAKGFIRPSTLPVSAGFFVGKIDGGLHPCMDYHGLNEITVKWSCLWFLQPWNSSEWPNTSANSICAVHTTSFTSAKEMNGREHSQPTQGTMSTFGLVNSPSVIQPFINDFFRDMLIRWVIVCRTCPACPSHSAMSHFSPIV